MDMKRWAGLTVKAGLVVFGVVVLAACGGAGAGGGSSAGTGTFTATITGARSGTVAGDGYFVCRSDGFLEEFEIASASAFTNVVAIYIPNTTQAGDTVSFTLISGNSGNYVGDTIGSDYFETENSGSVTLTAVPNAPGQSIAGNFDFTAANSSDEQVSVTGSFDIPASETSLAECQ